jgi:putative ABC transport system permease protein
MKFLRQFSALLRREKLDAEMAEEMRLHLEQRTREAVERGLSPDEARYTALRKFGGVEQAKELAREQRAFVWFDQFGQDVRYALRQFAKSPGFTTVVVLTLALGIGATAAIYSVVDAVVLHPVPGPDSDRLVQIGQWTQFGNSLTTDQTGVQPPVLEAIAAQREAFDDFTWCDSVQFTRNGEDFATTVFGTVVPANFFSFLSARPLIGRTFAPDEDRIFALDGPVVDNVMVLSHAWWKSEFGGDRNVVGRTIELSNHRFTIVGVMPEYFTYPGSQFWIPGQPARTRPRSVHAGNARVLIRLKESVAPQQAQAMMDGLAQRLMRDFPANDGSYGEYWRAKPGGLRLWGQPLREAMQNRTYGNSYDDLRRTLFAFLAAIGFVLLIACANIANLTLARAERRQHELAIRAALGAGRGRLVRQLLTEHVLLACCGGLAGLLLTAWGMKLLTTFVTMPRLRPIAVDGRVLVTALLVSAVTGILFGIAPAWRSARLRVTEKLSASGLAATASRAGRRYRDALVIIEVALAVVLLTGAGLMIQSVVRLLRVDPGLDPVNLTLVSTHLRASEPGRPSTIQQATAARNALLAQLHERISALPGVTAVGIFKRGLEGKFTLPGRTDPVLVLRAHTGVEAADFFRAARIPLVRGRYFTRDDIGEGNRNVIVNEALAQFYWPSEDAVGKRMRTSDQANSAEYEVVGVVGDARLYRLDQSPPPTFYRPYQEASLAGGAETLAIRTTSDPAGVIPAIRKELKAAAPRIEQPYIEVLRQTFYDRTLPQRTYRNYLVGFAGVGLLLAAIGVYGVLAYAVSRRTREIGIRIAIGATRRQVTALVMGAGARLVATGVVIGVAAAFWLSTLLEKQLFGVSAHEPAAMAGAILVLGLVAALACWLPARRAAAVDPVVALRTE